MKHIKKFENNSNKMYLVQETDNIDTIKNFIFYDTKSRDNFIINYIHERYIEDFDPEYYEDIENIFDPKELIKEYNTEENYIKLYTVDVFDNVDLKKELKIKRDAKKYNIL